MNSDGSERHLVGGFRPQLSDFLEEAVGWLACLSVLLLSVPAFIRLPFNLPGFQGLTPQKIVQPILFLAVIWLLAVRPREPRRADLPLVLMGIFVVWMLVSILVNRGNDLTNNLRVWIWLLMMFGLAIGVARAAARRKSAARLLLSGGIAVAVVVVFGFLEVYFAAPFDGFFKLFRPNWTALGLRGQGPVNVMGVHEVFGGSVRLMSTLGNDVCFFLPLGSVLVALAYVGERTREASRGKTLAWLFVVGGTGWAILLTQSRTAVGLAFVGLIALTLLSGRAGRAAPWHPVALFLALLVVNLTATATPLGAKFRGMDALFKSVPAASEPPIAEPEPRAEVRGKGASHSLQTAIARWSINQRAILASIAKDFAQHNPVFGIGLLNFRMRLYERGGRWDELGLSERVADVQDPHNFFLWLAAVAGIPGLILGAAIFATCLVSLASHWRRNPGNRLATAALISAWVVLAGFSLVGFTFMTTTAIGTFGALVGATSGYLGRSPQMPGSLPAHASGLQIG